MLNGNEIEARLWEYIDGFTNEQDKPTIEKLIAENAEWRTKYHELMEVHQTINLIELEQPSLRFTKNVMEEIAKYKIAPAAKKYINNKIVWGIGFFFITMIIGFLIYGIAQIDWNAASDSKSTLGIDLNKVDYSKIFDSSFVNVFMMLNVVLGLMLFDKYLTNKRKDIVKEV
jgi:regulatory protein YycI of two-component signal transduction system YycFG